VIRDHLQVTRITDSPSNQGHFLAKVLFMNMSLEQRCRNFAQTVSSPYYTLASLSVSMKVTSFLNITDRDLVKTSIPLIIEVMY
jgi:hypothetical protein